MTPPTDPADRQLDPALDPALDDERLLRDELDAEGDDLLVPVADAEHREHVLAEGAVQFRANGHRS